MTTTSNDEGYLKEGEAPEEIMWVGSDFRGARRARLKKINQSNDMVCMFWDVEIEQVNSAPFLLTDVLTTIGEHNRFGCIVRMSKHFYGFLISEDSYFWVMPDKFEDANFHRRIGMLPFIEIADKLYRYAKRWDKSDPNYVFPAEEVSILDKQLKFVDLDFRKDLISFWGDVFDLWEEEKLRELNPTADTART